MLLQVGRVWRQTGLHHACSADLDRSALQALPHESPARSQAVIGGAVAVLVVSTALSLRNGQNKGDVKEAGRKAEKEV